MEAQIKSLTGLYYLWSEVHWLWIYSAAKVTNYTWQPSPWCSAYYMDAIWRPMNNNSHLAGKLLPLHVFNSSHSQYLIEDQEGAHVHLFTLHVCALTLTVCLVLQKYVQCVLSDYADYNIRRLPPSSSCHLSSMSSSNPLWVPQGPKQVWCRQLCQ